MKIVLLGFMLGGMGALLEFSGVPFVLSLGLSFIIGINIILTKNGIK